MALILVIDDDGALRRAIRRILTGGGHDVLEAEDGDRGLELLRTHNPAVVITDIFMPGKEGIETIRAILLSHPGTRIIAMSGGGANPLSDGKMYLDAAHKFGAEAVLAKPFRAQELLEAVDSAVQSPNSHEI